MINRIISLALCAVMLCPPWTGRVEAAELGTLTSLPDWTLSSSFPAALGTVESRFETNSSQGLILIQDAHDVPEAQKKIEHLLHYFEKFRNVHQIALEGAEGPLDTFFLRSFPDTKKLSEKTLRLIHEGELSGGAGAALLARPEAAGKYAGLEKGALYRKTLTLYTEADAQTVKTAKWIEHETERLTAEKRKVYSPELFEIDQKVNAWQQRGARLEDLLKSLARTQKPEGFPSVEILLKELSPGTVSRNVLPAEMTRISAQAVKQLQELPGTGNVRRGRLKRFEAERQAYSNSEITAAVFLRQLERWDRQWELRLTWTPELVQEVRWQKKLDRVEGPKLFEEIERYSAGIKEKLFKSDGQKMLDWQNQVLQQLRQLNDFKLKSEEWDALQQSMQGPASENGIPVSWHRAWDRLFLKHREFYASVKARETGFLESLNLSNVQRGPRQWTVLVAGGFHTAGLEKAFCETGVTTLVILPKMRSAESPQRYSQHMRGDVLWKKYFLKVRGSVSPYFAFTRFMRDQLIEEKNKDTRMNWRDNLLRGLGHENRLSEAARYTDFLDETTAPIQPGAFYEKSERLLLDLKRLYSLDWTPQSIRRLLGRYSPQPKPGNRAVPRSGARSKTDGLKDSPHAGTVQPASTAQSWTGPMVFSPGFSLREIPQIRRSEVRAPGWETYRDETVVKWPPALQAQLAAELQKPRIQSGFKKAADTLFEEYFSFLTPDREVERKMLLLMYGKGGLLDAWALHAAQSYIFEETGDISSLLDSLVGEDNDPDAHVSIDDAYLELQRVFTTEGALNGFEEGGMYPWAASVLSAGSSVREKNAVEETLHRLYPDEETLRYDLMAEGVLPVWRDEGDGLKPHGALPLRDDRGFRFRMLMRAGIDMTGMAWYSSDEVGMLYRELEDSFVLEDKYGFRETEEKSKRSIEGLGDPGLVAWHDFSPEQLARLYFLFAFRASALVPFSRQNLRSNIQYILERLYWIDEQTELGEQETAPLRNQRYRHLFNAELGKILTAEAMTVDEAKDVLITAPPGFSVAVSDLTAEALQQILLLYPDLILQRFESGAAPLYILSRMPGAFTPTFFEPGSAVVYFHLKDEMYVDENVMDPFLNQGREDDTLRATARVDPEGGGIEMTKYSLKGKRAIEEKLTEERPLEAIFNKNQKPAEAKMPLDVFLQGAAPVLPEKAGRERLISEEQRRQVLENSKAFVQRFYLNYPVYPEDHPYVVQLNQVLQPLLKEKPARVMVYESDKIGAFALLTGQIFISSRLLKAIPSYEILRALLQHELRHIEREDTLYKQNLNDPAKYAGTVRISEFVADMAMLRELDDRGQNPVGGILLPQFLAKLLAEEEEKEGVPPAWRGVDPLHGSAADREIVARNLTSFFELPNLRHEETPFVLADPEGHGMTFEVLMTQEPDVFWRELRWHWAGTGSWQPVVRQWLKAKMGVTLTEKEEIGLFSFLDRFVFLAESKFMYVSNDGTAKEISSEDIPNYYTQDFFQRFFVQGLLTQAGIRFSDSLLPKLARLAVQGAFQETGERLSEFDARVIQLHREFDRLFQMQQKSEDDRGEWNTAWVSEWILRRSVLGHFTFDSKDEERIPRGDEESDEEPVEQPLEGYHYQSEASRKVTFSSIPFRGISKNDYLRMWEDLDKPALKFETILHDIGEKLTEDPEHIPAGSDGEKRKPRRIADVSLGYVVFNEPWTTFTDNINVLKDSFTASLSLAVTEHHDADGYLDGLYRLGQLAPPLEYGFGLAFHSQNEPDEFEDTAKDTSLFFYEPQDPIGSKAFDFLSSLSPAELRTALWNWQKRFASPAEGRRAVELALCRLQNYIGEAYGSFDDDASGTWNIRDTITLEEAQKYVIFQYFSGLDIDSYDILQHKLMDADIFVPLRTQDFFLRWLTDFTNEVLESRGYLSRKQAREFLVHKQQMFKEDLLQALSEREGDGLLQYAAATVENLGMVPATRIPDNIYEKYWSGVSEKVQKIFQVPGRHPATVEEARGLFSVMILSQDNMDGMNAAAVFFREMFRLTGNFDEGLALLERYRFLPPSLLYEAFTVLSEQKAKSQPQLQTLQERFEFHMGRQFGPSSRAVQNSMIAPLLRMIAGESRLTFFKGMLNTSDSDRDFKLFIAESWWKKIMTGNTDLGGIKEIARLAYFGEQKKDERLARARQKIKDPIDWEVPAYFNDWYPQFFRLDPFLIYVLIENLTLDGPDALFRKEDAKKELVAEFIKHHLKLSGDSTAEAVIDRITDVIAKDLRPEDLFFFLGPILKEISFQAPQTPLPDDEVVDDLLKKYLVQLSPDYPGIVESPKFEQTRGVIRQRIEQLVRGGDVISGDKDAFAILPAEESAAKHLLNEGLMHVRADYQKRMTPMELGVEAARHTGILAVRLVQLAGIYFKLSPDDQQAVLEVYDAVRGQLKVQAFSNMQRLEKDNPGLREFLDTLAEIDEMIGGGSIVTVYRALRTGGSEIALGVQNPNAEYRSEELRRFLMQILDGLVRRSEAGSEEQRVYQLLGQLLDRAHRSVVREINDKQFIELNKKFWRMNDVSSRSRGRFKPSKGLKTRLVVPDVSDTGALRVRANEFKKGQSLNYLIQEVSEILARGPDGRTADETKKVLQAKDAAAVLVQNYLHQIFESGLAHADIHPGQFNMLPKNRLAVFDLKDLTRISDAEKDLLRQAFAKALLQNQEGVVDLLADYLMPAEIRADKERIDKLKKRVFKALDSAESDTMLGKILFVLEEEGVQIPDTWVGIAKNIIALNHMAKRVGFSHMIDVFTYDPQAEGGAGVNFEAALKHILEVLPNFSQDLVREIGLEQLQSLYPKLKIPKMRSEVRISQASSNAAEPLIRALNAGQDLRPWASKIYRAADRQGWEDFETAYRREIGLSRSRGGDKSFVDALTAERERRRLLATLGPALPDEKVQLGVLLREGAGTYWFEQAIESGYVGTLLVDGALPGQGLLDRLKQALIQVRPVRVQKPLRDGSRGIPLAIPGGGQTLPDLSYLPFILKSIGDGSPADEYTQTLAFVLMVHTARLLRGTPALAGNPAKLRSELRKIVGLQGYFDAMVSLNGARGFEISALEARVFLAAQTRQALEQAA